MPANHQAYPVIYVPGLGDSRPTLQRAAVWLWRLQGVEPYLYQMSWADGKPFQPKFDGLMDLIGRLNRPVGLIGASAGAGVVLHVYARQPERIAGVVCVCGKIQNGQTVSPATYQYNPAFRESMEQLPDSLRAISRPGRERILSLHPPLDESVPPGDTYIDGAQAGLIPISGHAPAIAYSLTFGSFRINRFLQQQPQPV